MTNISNNMPVPPFLPGRDGDPGLDGDALDPTVAEVDGETRIDPDADPDRVDSAEADRIASGSDD